MVVLADAVAGCTMATPMKPLVEPTVAGVSMARRSPPRLRLCSVSLRSTILDGF